MGRRIEEKAETSPLHPTLFQGSYSLLYFQLFYLFLNLSSAGDGEWAW